MSRVRALATGLTPADACLAVLLLLAAWAFWRQSREFTFFQDEWSFVTGRRGGGLDDFLEPHVDHLSAVPVAVYKLLFRTAGLDDYDPYRLAGIAAHLACGVLLFLIVRRRLGPWGGLVAVTPVLFLGYAWENIVWPFQVGFLCAIAGGLAALLALERGDRRGDVLASAALLFALASSSPAMAFVVAVAARILWTPGERRRIWVVIAPLAVYGLWYLAHGHSTADLDNVPSLPSYAGASISGSVGAVTGLGLDLGRPLAAIGAVLLVRRLLEPGPIPAPLVGALAGGATWWTAITLTRAMQESPTTPRYLYPGAVFVVLIAVEAVVALTASGRAPASRRTLAVLGALAALAAVGNIGPLRDAALERRQTFDTERGELAAVEIARDRVAPDFRPIPAQPVVEAGPYLRAVDDIGSSPAYSEAQLAIRPEPVRARADGVLTAALGVTPQPGRRHAPAGPPPVVEGHLGGEPRPDRSCVTLEPGPEGGTLDMRVPASGLNVTPREPAELRLRRFAGIWSLKPLATLVPGTTVTLRIPPDRSARPWHARLTSAGVLTACTAA